MKVPQSWYVASRLEELRGESRANALRVLGVVVFYAIEVMNYRGLALGPLQIPRVEGIDEGFHAMATALAVGWMAVCASVVIALGNRIFPPALKYLTTGADLALLSGVLMLADGPRSPMVLALFLVIPLAALRLSERLVGFAAGGAALAYGSVLVDVARRRPELAVPAHWSITTVAALALAGVVVWQVVQSAQRAAQIYHQLESRRLAGAGASEAPAAPSAAAEPSEPSEPSEPRQDAS